MKFFLNWQKSKWKNFKTQAKKLKTQAKNSGSGGHLPLTCPQVVLKKMPDLDRIYRAIQNLESLITKVWHFKGTKAASRSQEGDDGKMGEF